MSPLLSFVSPARYAELFEPLRKLLEPVDPILQELVLVEVLFRHAEYLANIVHFLVLFELVVSILPLIFCQIVVLIALFVLVLHDPDFDGVDIIFYYGERIVFLVAFDQPIHLLHELLLHGADVFLFAEDIIFA